MKRDGTVDKEVKRRLMQVKPDPEGISQAEHLRILNHEIGIAGGKGYHEAMFEAHAVADKVRPLLESALALLPRPGIKVVLPDNCLPGASLAPPTRKSLNTS